jgi:hypothetical protein
MPKMYITGINAEKGSCSVKEQADTFLMKLLPASCQTFSNEYLMDLAFPNMCENEV